MTRDPQKRCAAEQTKLKPGESVLLEAAKRLTDAACALLRQHPITKENLERVHQATRLLEELLTFAPSSDPQVSRTELEAGRDALEKLTSAQEADETLLMAGIRRGRLVVRRHVAAIALGAKKRNPRLTRLELAQQFCACSKAHHSKSCAERLRRDIQRLNELIRRILRDYPA
jgi:hypothetical protein